MYTRKVGKKTLISFNREEFILLIQDKLLKENEKIEDFIIHSNIPLNLDFELIYIKRLSEIEALDRKKSLELARQENFSTVLKDFKAKTNGEDSKLINRMCNAFERYGMFDNLEEVISCSFSDILKFRGVGEKGARLFEGYLKNKGYRFAKWNGREYE